MSPWAWPRPVTSRLPTGCAPTKVPFAPDGQCAVLASNMARIRCVPRQRTCTGHPVSTSNPHAPIRRGTSIRFDGLAKHGSVQGDTQERRLRRWVTSLHVTPAEPAQRVRRRLQLSAACPLPPIAMTRLAGRCQAVLDISSRTPSSCSS
jgi:hypothetical protein